MDLNIKSALENLEKNIIAKNRQVKFLRDEIKKLKQQSSKSQLFRPTSPAKNQQTDTANILFGKRQDEELDISLEQLKDIVSKK